ncbi:MAG: ABC transporter permease [Bacillota bacterium]|nr:ABC transporter permease [Bacillota bacterium]
MKERAEHFWWDLARRLLRRPVAVVSLFFIAALVLVAIFASFLAPANPNQQELLSRLAPPGSPSDFTRTGTFILGSDQVGRDILSRILYGSRISLAVGLVAVSIELFLGTLMGALAGYFGGWVDTAIMRLADIMFAFPSLLFAIAVMYALGPSLFNVFVALGVTGWAGLARLVRGEVLRLKTQEFVEAAKAAGSTHGRLILKHILPNAVAPLIVAATLGIPGAIMGEAALSFLGLGVQPPTPSWGSMIYEARSYIRVAPWFSIWPGLAIMATVFAFNLLGDALRDILDPRLRQ